MSPTAAEKKDLDSPAGAAPFDPALPYTRSQIAKIERDVRAEIERVREVHPVLRSSRVEVRNPITGLPSFEKLAALSPEARAALVAILGDIATDSRERAEKCWRTHKAPMAAYWKACSVYAGHIKRALAKATRPVDETTLQVRRPSAAEPPQS